MNPISNFDSITAAGEFEKLPVGGYVIRITDCEDKAVSEYLLITFDIAEGEHKDHFKDTDADHVYSHQFIRSYKESALRMFKGFTEAIEKSNPGYKWDWNEKGLKGKLLGVIIGEEEYENNRGEVKTGLKVRAVRSADTIRKGDYKVPELKKLPEAKKTASPVQGFTPLTDENVPF